MNSLLITSLCVTQRLTRLIRLAGLLLVLAMPTIAQAVDDGDRLAHQLADNVANDVAKNVADNLASCANFEQRRWMADLDTQLVSTGYFLRQGDGLIWQTTSPVADRVQLTPGDPDLPMSLEVMLPVLTGLLAGDWAALRQHFAIDQTGEPDAWQARMTPLDDAVATRLKSIRVSGGEQIERLELAFVNDDRVDIQLTPADCAALDASSAQ